jgi:hypothetical protein
MPTVDPADVVWIEVAATEFERSRRWLNERIDERRLSVVKIPGDKKVYLLRSEIMALLEPQIKQPREEGAG